VPVRAWAQSKQRKAIAIAVVPLVVCMAMGATRVAWTLAQGFLAGITIAAAAGMAYLYAANREPGARAVVVSRWIATSLQREWAAIGGRHGVPTNDVELDAWLHDAPPGLATDLWAAALSVAFGAADRARTIQSRLSAADDATSQFYAARLASLIALEEGERIDVERLRSKISSLPTQEQWRAIGSLATLEAGAAANRERCHTLKRN
jgi:hypothetical protein